MVNDIILLGSRKKREDPNIIKLGSKIISPKGVQVISPATAIKTITSPKLTVGLVGTLVGLKGGLFAGAKAAALTALGLGALQASPILRKKTIEKVRDPLAAGRFVGKQIEKIAKPKPDEPSKTLKERVVEGAKKAGLIGAGVALAGAGIVAVKKVKERVSKPITLSKVPKIVPGAITPGVLGAPAFIGGVPEAPVAIRVPTEPVAVKEKPFMPNITQRVNIRIDNRSKAVHSRRFINKFILK